MADDISRDDADALATLQKKILSDPSSTADQKLAALISILQLRNVI